MTSQFLLIWDVSWGGKGAGKMKHIAAAINLLLMDSRVLTGAEVIYFYVEEYVSI